MSDIETQDMYKFGLLLLLLCALLACHKKNNSTCLSFEKAPIIAVDGPHAAKVNESISIKVSFVVFNGCGQFGRFEESVVENLTKISVIAKYEGCRCTLDIPRRETQYTFVAPSAGEYVMEFEAVDAEHTIRDTITVQ